MSIPKQDERTPVYTEGVCGDGAMILRDGQPFPISSAIDALNAYDSTEALREALAPFASAHERFEAGLDDCIAEHFDNSEICDGVTWGDLRRARAALSGSREKESV